jgi:hypothetical protein
MNRPVTTKKNPRLSCRNYFSSETKNRNQFAMKLLLLPILLAWPGILLAQSVSVHYRISIQFNPDSSSLQAQAEITNPGDSCFFLAPGLKIESVKADGKTIGFQEKQKPQLNSKAIILAFVPAKLEIMYSGQIKPEDFPKTVSSINGINKDWIELSERIDWFPRLANHSSFDYELEADVPGNFVTVTGARQTGLKTAADRSISRWKTENKVWGITLLSAPALKKCETTQNGMNLEIYYQNLAPAYIDSMKNNLLKSIKILTGLFGPTSSENVVKVAYSPRSAGAYARKPLILVSEKYADEQRLLKFGYARDFRLNTHEIAHYWSFANSGAPEDWMNEGLAEFSALLVSEKVIGNCFSDLLIDEYTGMVNSTPTQLAIAETPNDSWEREINRYYKPTLLFCQLIRKYGEEKTGLFLKTLYLAMVKEKVATTARFLEVMEQTMGKEAKDFFAEAIYRKGWNTGKNPVVQSFQANDPAFAGTWSGPLTQFGTTAKFVLNLLWKGGKLEPSLGSPDQNVGNIPVSELMIEGDVISFRVGIASAVYKGTLDRTSHEIKGVWTQRGVDYPLNIASEN